VEKKGGAYDPRAVCAAMERREYGQKELTRRAAAGKRRKSRRSNPEGEATDAYMGFHGHEPEEEVVVKRDVHFHEHLAGAGKLVKLTVKNDFASVDLTGFKGALFAFNEERNQLYIEGGDQSVDLRKFGIRNPHEMETLGQVVGVEYHTRKDHLGKEGGNAIYVHKFDKPYPDLLYDVRNEKLLFSGGRYDIPNEGIDH
jgi:hypothetical protein